MHRVASVCLALALWIGSALPAAAAPPPQVSFQRFGSAADFATGAFDQVEPASDALTLAADATSGSWTSPWVDPGFSAVRLIASWNADTPDDSWVQIDLQATTSDGAPTPWYVMGVWAFDDTAIQRTSHTGQADAEATVETDTLVARDQPLVAYRLRASLQRSAPDRASPSLRMLGAMASTTGRSRLDATSSPGLASGVELAIPAYSQEIHAGEYPRWAGGGETWCSPTSTEMVVEYWGRGPSPDELAWVDPSIADPSVDFAARHTYDAAYRGTGNWPFNAAYAAHYGLDGFVTQLRSLNEAEQFLAAGIPLIASIAVGPRQLNGFLFDGGTNGHLVVIGGFTDAGDPIVYDPAATSDATVRRVYDRGQFERAWLGGSGGIVYVIHPASVPLPLHPADGTPSW